MRCTRRDRILCSIFQNILSEISFTFELCQRRSSIDIFNRCSNFNSQNLISSPPSFKDIGAREIKYKKSHLCGQVWYDPVCWFWIRVIRQHITLSRPITRVLNRRQFSSAHILSGHIFHPPCSSVVEDQATASPANSTTLAHLPIYVPCPIQYSCPMYYVLCLMPNTVYMSYRLCTMNYVLCDELLYHHAV